ncbi:cytochrome b [Azospirillum soli]|nr:cytochrome b [Azospirillum soli]
MPPRKPTAAEMTVLLFFHAALSGAFIIAQMTGDEDTYVLHQVAGYTALAAIAVRVVAGLLAPTGSPLRLPRPTWSLGNQRRNPVYAWMAAILLVVIGASAVTGAISDVVVAVEHLHEAISEFSLPIVIGHVALVLLLQALKHGSKPEIRAL